MYSALAKYHLCHSYSLISHSSLMFFFNPRPLTHGQKLVGKLIITNLFPKPIEILICQATGDRSAFYKKLSVINIIGEQDKILLAHLKLIIICMIF